MLNDTRNMLTLAREDLACYAIAMQPSLELAAHHEALIQHLQAVERGDLRRLMIFMPPQHGKSTFTSQLFPAWHVGRRPDKPVVLATYGQDLSDTFGRRVRNLACDARHGAIFPQCVVSNDSSSQQRFDTTAGGGFYAIGRGGALTGRPAWLLLIDDPLKDAEEARSATIRRNLHDWYQYVARTRLNPKGAIVIIQTRWHEDDLAGWLLREHNDEDEPWTVINMPAIAETDEPFRKTGEALWPEVYPLDVLAKIRADVGGAAWTSLYQCRPAAAEGAVFKRDWFRHYSEVPELKRVIVSLDAAFKTGKQNDYSAVTIWGETRNGFYLLWLWRERAEFPKLKVKTKELASQWNANEVLIEDAASGQSLIQELRQDTALPIKAVKVDRDKETRAHAVTPLFESGRVFFPESAPWLADYEDELASFPAGAHDDAVDSTTMALNHLRSHTYGLFEWYRQQAEELNAKPATSQETPSELASSLADAQKRSAGVLTHTSRSQRPAAATQITSACPQCGSEVARYCDGNWRCNICGSKGQDPPPEKPKRSREQLTISAEDRARTVLKSFTETR